MTQILQQAKTLLAKGNLDKTFKLLKEFCASNPKYKNIANLLIQYESKFSQIKKDEATGIISIDNARIGYNRTTKDLLNLIQKVEKGDFSGSLETMDNNAPKKKQFIPIIAIILIGVIGLFVYQKALKPRQHTPTAKVCPDFKSTAKFNIMVLPFTDISGGNQHIPIHKQLKNRLIKFSRNHHLNTSVDLSEINPADDKQYPDDNAAAKKLCKKCRANLIIWGTYEKQAADKTIVNTDFQFVLDHDQLSFGQYQINEDNELSTIPSISSIASSGSISSSIEDQISLILGVAANQMGEDQAAIELLESATKPADKQLATMAGMALADSYIETNNEQKAVKTYTKILNLNPKNELALSNRAALSQKTGDYKTALKDTKSLAKIRPESKTLKIKEVQLLIMNNELKTAKEKIEKLQEANVAPKKIEKAKELYKMKKENPAYRLFDPNKTTHIKKIN